MTSSISPDRAQSRPDLHDALRALATLPAWLTTPLQTEQLLAALRRAIPEARDGALQLALAEPLRLFLKNHSGRWRGTVPLELVRRPDEPPATVRLRLELSPPGSAAPTDPDATTSFGTPGWQCNLPELGLRCSVEPPEQALEVLSQLTDPVAARELLENGLSRHGLQPRSVSMRGCQPHVLNYKPGSRCTLRYDLDFAPGGDGPGLPATVIAKTYRGSKGEQAFRGMAALWQSPLSRSTEVRIAEPLAYVPQSKLLIQAALPEQETLEALLRATLFDPAPAARDRLISLLRSVAQGLAELHTSGATATEQTTWDERAADLYDLLERLAVVAPDVSVAVRPLVTELEALAQLPADPLVPSHGTFDADQVLLSGDQLSLIDFDSFCMAEPALDVGHFRAALIDSGMKLVGPETLADPQACRAALQHLDQLGAHFLAAYREHAPVSTERLALWEGWDYLRDCLHLWTKPRAGSTQAVVRILEFYLEERGLLA